MRIRRIAATAFATVALAATGVGLAAGPANALPPDCDGMTDTVTLDWLNAHNAASTWGPLSYYAILWSQRAEVDQARADAAGC